MDHQCFRGNLIAGTSLHPLERHCEKTVINVYCLNGSSMFSWQSHRWNVIAPDRTSLRENGN